MSRKYKFLDSQGIYFVSFAVVYWIDVFIRDEYRNIFLESMRYCQKEKGLQLFGWCLMPSHVHLLMAAGRNTPPETLLQNIKSFTSRQLKKAIQENPVESRKEWMLWMMQRAGLKNSNNVDFQFWQQHNHPILVQSLDMCEQKLSYIHRNPVVAGFVEYPEEWLHSSARDYQGKKGLLDVELI